jgi:hypothetical protein
MFLAAAICVTYIPQDVIAPDLMLYNVMLIVLVFF